MLIGNSLLETCLQLEAPGQNIFMRIIPIVPVLDQAHAPVAAQTVSLLCGAYISQGGALATTAGVGVFKEALEIPDEGWLNVAYTMINQNVFMTNHARTVEWVEMDKFYVKYKEPGSELVELKRALEKKARAEAVLKQ